MRENILVTVQRVLFRRQGRHGVFRENLIIPVFVSEPGGAFHADVCRDAAQDHGRYAHF